MLLPIAVRYSKLESTTLQNWISKEMSKKTSRAASPAAPLAPAVNREGMLRPSSARRSNNCWGRESLGQARVQWCLSDDASIRTYTGPIHKLILGSDGLQVTGWHVQWGADPTDLDVFPPEDERFVLVAGGVARDLVRTKVPLSRLTYCNSSRQ